MYKNSKKTKLTDNEVNAIIDGILMNEEQLLENKIFSDWLEKKLLEKENIELKEKLAKQNQ